MRQIFEGNSSVSLKMNMMKEFVFVISKMVNCSQLAENMRLSILGKDSKTKDEKPLGVVDTYVKEKIQRS